MDWDQGRTKRRSGSSNNQNTYRKGSQTQKAKSNENELAAGRREVQRCRWAHACGFGRIQLRCLLTLRSEEPSSNREAWFAYSVAGVAAHCASQIRARHSVAGVPKDGNRRGWAEGPTLRATCRDQESGCGLELRELPSPIQHSMPQAHRRQREDLTLIHGITVILRLRNAADVVYIILESREEKQQSKRRPTREPNVARCTHPRLNDWHHGYLELNPTPNSSNSS
jgi:hypothetical protein